MKYFLKKAVSAGLSFLMVCTVCLPVSAEIPQGSLMFSAEDTKQVRQQKTEYNRAYAILFSILASSAAYAPEKGIERTYLRDHGWNFTPHQITDGKTTVHFIMRNSDGMPPNVPMTLEGRSRNSLTGLTT